MTSLLTPSTETEKESFSSPPPEQRPKSKLLKTSLWLIFWLALADIAINLLFPFPTNPTQKPNSLERYFDYGRSIEGKLNRMVEQPTEDNINILNAGWVNPTTWQDLPTKPEASDDLLVAVYGMSFSNNIAQELIDLDDKITLRSLGGPSAPANHSYATFSADTEGRSADVAIMGVLSSSIKRIHSLSGTSWSYENPTPYTYPYYTLNDKAQLIKTEPAIQTGDQFITAITRNTQDWQQFKQQMRQIDSPFSAFVFNSNFSDRSALIRLIRRGWANRIIAQSEKDLYDSQKGFNPNATEIKTLKAILNEFTRTAKSAQQVPIILLINDQGYQNHLYEVLSSHLRELQTPVFNTYDIVSADDPTNFVADGHFTPEGDRQLAAELRTLIRQQTNTP